MVQSCPFNNPFLVGLILLAMGLASKGSKTTWTATGR